jgi:hypothetical protein
LKVVKSKGLAPSNGLRESRTLSSTVYKEGMTRIRSLVQFLTGSF